ncbi:MAG: rod shape-determining protein [Armatimonadetes bacterium]|nr:rod shape-determining protein [Armatimonadota bacterium]
MLFPWTEEIGIDLGTANTHVCVKSGGVVVRESTAVAFQAARRRPICYGTEARRMMERQVPGVDVVRPLRHGAVADFDAAVDLLRHFMRQALGRRPLLFSPAVVVAAPLDASAVQRNALTHSLRAAGAGHTDVVPKALAAAIGARLPVAGVESRVIVDVGAGATDIGVISMGAVTAGCTLRYGGDDIDQALVRAIRRSQGVRVDPVSAEEVKIRVGSVHPDLGQDRVTLNGTSTNGNGGSEPTSIVVQGASELLLKAVLPIVGEIAWVLEDLPPKQRAEVEESGVTLTGGCALLRGFPELITHHLGIPATVAKDPLSCTILGLESITADLSALTLEGRRFASTS